MFQQQAYVISTILMLVDAACVAIAGYFADYQAFEVTDGLWRVASLYFDISVLTMLLLNNYVMGRLGLYDDRKISIRFDLIWRIFKAIAADFTLLIAAFSLVGQPDHYQAFALWFAALSFALISCERICAHLYINRLSRARTYARKLLVVGDPERAQLVIRALEEQVSWGHEVVATLDPKCSEGQSEQFDTLDELRGVLERGGIDGVIFAVDGDRRVDLGGCVAACRDMGIPARILPALWQPGPGGLSVEKCQGIPFLTIRTDNFNATGMLYKRMLDFVGGLIGSLIFAFMYPVVGLAIKWDSTGPVLFKQKRVGRNGRTFDIYKFRTMRMDAEALKQELIAQNEMKGAMFKIKHDPRVTRIGRFLRKTSLDEFPQFLNVLKGDMSLVGTRPPTIDEVNTYEPWQRRRISEKPGVTGLWQISGRNAIRDFSEVVALDCQYLENWRFRDDLKILLKTFQVVFARKGAS